ncbi:MAG: glycosyl transferase [Arcobacter sp.]|nr:MAG: glycosyl transferase [Arcobacter sp.]
MRFHDFLKAVGTGPKGNRHLSREEMKEAMSMMLDGTAIPEQTAAFLLGWRVQIEDKDELLGAIDAMDTFVKQTPIKKSLEIGYPLDGKIKSLPIMLLAAGLIPKVPIVVHGDRAQPSKLGFNPKDFFENTKFSSNLHYFDRANFFPELSKLTDLRRALGLRTAFNTIEKLHNVGSSDFALIGMHHLPYFDLYKELYGQRYKRLVIVRGSEGTPEILKKTNMLVVEGGHSHSLPIDPAYYGLKPFEAKKEMSLEEMIKQLENPNEQILGYARLNAALLLYTANQSPSIEEAYATLKSNYDKLCKKYLG